MTKKVKISLIISILFVGLIRLQPFWVRIPGGFWYILFYLVIFVLFFWLIVGILKEIIILIKLRKNLNFKLFIPILIMIFMLLDGIFNPLRIELHRMYGKVVFRACFEGTMNQATFQLLDNNRFEIHWTGVFFYEEYFIGTYDKRGDTLYLDYWGEPPGRFGQKILMNNDEEILETLSKDYDSLKNYAPFYYGFCKGLN